MACRPYGKSFSTFFFSPPIFTHFQSCPIKDNWCTEARLKIERLQEHMFDIYGFFLVSLSQLCFMYKFYRFFFFTVGVQIHFLNDWYVYIGTLFPTPDTNSFLYLKFHMLSRERFTLCSRLKTILEPQHTWASQLSVNQVYECHSPCCQTHVNQPCENYPMCQACS